MNVPPFRSGAAILLIAVVTSCGRHGADSRTGRAPVIAVIPKGTSHEYWKSVHAGALQAARELAQHGDTVKIIWKGPLREDDREQQVQVVEGFVSQGVQGIVLAPLDNRALVRPVEEAKAAGVPTVIIDSGLESADAVSFVATDNRHGGELAADRMGQLLGGRGKVLVLRYAEGSASTMDRESGFLDRLHAKYPGISVVSSDQYAGATRETAKRAAENLLNRFGGDLQGVFTPNESVTIGMLLALQDEGRVGRIRFVGFDASPILVDAIRAHQLDGIAVQNPRRMGYLGVTTMLAHLRGKAVAPRIDTGVSLVTAENLDTPASRALLAPPTDQELVEP